MSVKVAIPRDIESSFNSSIAMPDVPRGEMEWQEELHRIVEINAMPARSPLIDSVYDADNGLYCLSGNESIGYTLEKFSESGASISSIQIPSLSSPPSIISTKTSLSFDAVNNKLMIGAATWIEGGGPLEKPDSWAFEFLSVDVNLTSYSPIYLPDNFGYADHGKGSAFKFKTDGTNVIFLAIKKTNPTDSEINRELAAFRLNNMLLIGKLPSGFADFFVTDNNFYLTSGQPVFTGGSLSGSVSVFSEELKEIRSITFRLPESGSSGFKVNAAKSIVTVLTSPTSTGVKAQILDRDMINIGSYRRNDEVVKSSTKRKYRCAVEATFDDPEIGVNLSPPTWTDVGSTNRFAVLDSNTSQRSIFNNSGFVSCSITSPVDTVGIFGLSGVQSATVSVISGGSTLYAETKSGMDSEFSDVEIRDLVFDIPPFSNVTIRVNFTGSNVRVGRFAVGVSETIGRAVPGTELGDIDYSILEFDEFGNTRYVPRPIVSFHTFQVDVAKQKSLSVARKLQSIGGKDAIWSADVGLSEPLVAIGKCERFPITYDNPTIVSYTVKVRGTA